MKSISSIRKKFESLKRKFNSERIKKCYENMGNQYLSQFNHFIGSEYNYSYYDRLEINILQKELFEIVTK